MKKLLLSLVIVFFIMGCFAQENSTTPKQSHADFIIVDLVTSYFHFNIDSRAFPLSFKGFTNLRPPAVQPYYKIVNGCIVGQKETIRYILKPNEVGPYIIESPIYYILGSGIKGWNKLTITAFNTPEKGEIRIINPDQTYIYILGIEYKDIEKFINTSLEFYRVLSKKEFKLLEKINKKIKDSDIIFTEDMYAFIQQNIRYPENALNKGITGVVYIDITVEKDGTISNSDVVVVGVDPELDLEAIRIVNLLPKLEFKKQMNTAVRFLLPIRFSIHY